MVADDEYEMAMADVFLLKDERPGGVEEGEEEAPDAVSALATSLPRDPTMRSSSGGGRGRVVQVQGGRGGAGGGGGGGSTSSDASGWVRAVVTSTIKIRLTLDNT